MNRQGFTLVEMIIALLILTVAVLGIGATAGQMARTAGTAEVDALALQAVEDRISSIMLDPRYQWLDSLYAGSESSIVGLDQYTRETDVTRYQLPGSGGRTIDYTRITVTVDGPGSADDVSRSLVLGAP